MAADASCAKPPHETRPQRQRGCNDCILPTGNNALGTARWSAQRETVLRRVSLLLLDNWVANLCHCTASKMDIRACFLGRHIFPSKHFKWTFFRVNAYESIQPLLLSDRSWKWAVKAAGTSTPYVVLHFKSTVHRTCAKTGGGGNYN